MNRLYSLTIEGTDDSDDGVGINLPKLLDVLGKLPRKPTLRLCLEFGVEEENYLHYAKALRSAGYPILLQPIDSEDMHRYSATGYFEKFQSALKFLSPYIDYLELANEINGDWVGTHALDKLNAVWGLKPNGVYSVVTIYVNDFYDGWIEHYLPPLRANYLFYSVYPLSEERAGNFITDGRMMKSPYYVGVGEYGSENRSGEMGSLGAKTKLIEEFETRKPQTPNDVIGGFYWDFYDDCVKNETGVLEVFQRVWK